MPVTIRTIPATWCLPASGQLLKSIRENNRVLRIPNDGYGLPDSSYRIASANFHVYMIGVVQTHMYHRQITGEPYVTYGSMNFIHSIILAG